MTEVSHSDAELVKGRKRLVKDAADALSDLNIFAAIVALLESGLNRSPTYRTAERIIKIAKEEQQRCLKRYDKHVAEATTR